MNELLVFTDGGARGNPGSAAIGVYIEDDSGNKVASIGQKIGETTNNVAEYSAVIAALNWIVENKEKIVTVKKISIFMDSQLVYSQIIGLYKVKNENLRSLIFTLREKEAQIPFDIFYFHIPREKNFQSDKLVNLALDGKL